MLLSKIEGTTPRLLDLTTLPELNETGMTNDDYVIRCLCVDFVRVTNCFYDYDYVLLLVAIYLAPVITGKKSRKHIITACIILAMKF